LTFEVRLSEVNILSTLSHLSEEALWASGLAARLRLLQANLADDSPVTRQQCLRDLIQQHVTELTPSKRRAHLDALRDRFPAWQAAQAAPPATAEAAAPETPESALNRLLEMAGGLSPDARAAMSRRLHAAGFAISQGGGGLPDLSPEMQKKFGLAAGQQLNSERALKLLTGLTEMVLALDQLVWTLWKQLNPKSNFRKEGDFAKSLGPFLSGDPEVPTALVAQPLDRTRKLIAALLGAVGRGGANFAAKHVARFGPDAIEDLAKLERTFMQSVEVTAWKKYRELFKEYCAEAAVENDVQQAIAKVAEGLLQGPGRGGG
jgi:hypothetical protein